MSTERPASKSERTKARIVAAALDLFRERGYEQTTMRMVAEAAEVSLGNAYYYFASKELLLQAFYGEVDAAQQAAAAPVLARERTLHQRLRGVLLARLEVIEPYHRFSGLMFRIAADPKSPLNPFHPQGAEVRRQGERLFEQVLDGSSTRLPKDLRRQLPGLLWTCSMGIVLFWIHDDSPGRTRTRALIEQSAAAIADAVRMAANPLLAPFRRRLLRMVEAVAGAAGGAGGTAR